MSVSELFDPGAWVSAPGADAYTDTTAHRSHDGRIARIAFDRPEVRNAFRPHTVDELFDALERVRQDPQVGVVLLTGNGPSPKDGVWAFCSGGDQRIRGRDGYKYSADTETVTDAARAGRLHILEVQRLIRFMPKPVIAVVPGWAAGGGHSLHVVCDLTIASAEHARFKQTDAEVGLLRRRVRVRLSGAPGGAEGGAGSVLPRRGVLGPARVRDGRGEPGGAAC